MVGGLFDSSKQDGKLRAAAAGRIAEDSKQIGGGGDKNWELLVMTRLCANGRASNSSVPELLRA